MTVCKDVVFCTINISNCSLVPPHFTQCIRHKIVIALEFSIYYVVAEISTMVSVQTNN